MKCASCHQPITAGQQADKRVEYRRQPDRTVKVFGVQMPDGKLSEATGILVKAVHSKCYWIARRQEERAAPPDATAGGNEEVPAGERD